MTIMLFKPKKRPNNEWTINVIRFMETPNAFTIIATVRHVKTKRHSSEFTIEYGKHSGTINIESTGYGWNTSIDKNLGMPEDIVRAALKKPIVVSVMFHVGTSPINQTERMNRFFDCNVFRTTIEK